MARFLLIGVFVEVESVGSPGHSTVAAQRGVLWTCRWSEAVTPPPPPSPIPVRAGLSCPSLPYLRIHRHKVLMRHFSPKLPNLSPVVPSITPQVTPPRPSQHSVSSVLWELKGREKEGGGGGMASRTQDLPLSGRYAREGVPSLPCDLPRPTTGNLPPSLCSLSGRGSTFASRRTTKVTPDVNCFPHKMDVDPRRPRMNVSRRRCRERGS